MNQFKEKIQKLVSHANLDKALDELAAWAKTQDDSDLENNVILLTSQYKETKRNEFSGLLSLSESRVQKTRIANAILSILPKDDNFINNFSNENQKEEMIDEIQLGRFIKDVDDNIINLNIVKNIPILLSWSTKCLNLVKVRYEGDMDVFENVIQVWELAHKKVSTANLVNKTYIDELFDFLVDFYSSLVNDQEINSQANEEEILKLKAQSGTIEDLRKWVEYAANLIVDKTVRKQRLLDFETAVSNNERKLSSFLSKIETLKKLRNQFI